MIVLANEEFATGLRLAGVKKSYHVTDKEQAKEILSNAEKHELIIITQKILSIYPEIEEFPKLVTFPEELQDFSKIDDLKKITKIAIGAEVSI
jgi:vacuolar-type H+-ATPase subunit F/Vma7